MWSSIGGAGGRLRCRRFCWERQHPQQQWRRRVGFGNQRARSGDERVPPAKVPGVVGGFLLAGAVLAAAATGALWCFVRRLDAHSYSSSYSVTATNNAPNLARVRLPPQPPVRRMYPLRAVLALA